MHLERLQNLFRELFQFETAELDFGLYRLLHLKRAEVEVFLNVQLPRTVDQAFQSVASKERSVLEKQIADLAIQIREKVADDAISPTGDPDPAYAKVKLVRDYMGKRQQLAIIQVNETHKADVFNHLYNFFSRYYEDGDFIPKLRYGAHEAYAVPYDGQEVFFHWANKGQHYVKTVDTFKDYAFKVMTAEGEYRLRFVLIAASVPKENTKGDRRYFLPRPDMIVYNKGAQELRIPFEYRLPTDDDIQRFKRTKKAKRPDQAKILVAALNVILEKTPDTNLRTALAEDQRVEEQKADKNSQPMPLLLRRMMHFVRRSTSDYFVQKDLRSFLRRELELYIKDQVLHIEDIAGDFEAKRRMITVLRTLGNQVIEFLAEIEDAQKRLFEKKKFVLQTEYLIPIQHVPRGFWPDILKNKAQVQQWKDWFAIDFNKSSKMRDGFLKSHPTLVVDTRNFDPIWTRQLMEALPFDDIDDAIDGLLICAENYQALRLLAARYLHSVRFIYADPPYNTGTDNFIFKDRYQHSTWLSMMAERIPLAATLLKDIGVFAMSIDDNEVGSAKILIDNTFGRSGHLGTFVWRRRISSSMSKLLMSTDHEYVLTYSRMPERAYIRGDLRDMSKFDQVDEQSRKYASMPLSVGMTREQRPNQWYPLKNPKTGKEYWPPEGRVWVYYPPTMMEKIAQGKIIWPEDYPEKNLTAPRLKLYPEDLKRKTRPVSTWVAGKRASKKGSKVTLMVSGRNEEATRLLKDMIGETPSALYPKPLSLLVSLCRQFLPPGESVLDFVAGSGTTAHAVITLNREDGSFRKFVVVEMAEYFDGILLCRIAKAMYAPEWKDRRPQRYPTEEEAKRTPRILKVIQLESYEDSLHNVTAQAAKSSDRVIGIKAAIGEDEYRLRYLFKLPLEAAETMLDVLKMEHPFDYVLEILTDDGPKQQPVDLIETFHWLYGLRPRKFATWLNSRDKTKKDKDGRVYRVTKATDREKKKRILVVWRDMTDLNPVTERVFLEAEVKKMAEMGETWDQMLINGDCALAGFKSLDGLFKQLMMKGEDLAA